MRYFLTICLLCTVGFAQSPEKLTKKYGVVSQKPESPQKVVLVQDCGAKYFWMRGHWKWSAEDQTYHWVAPHCEKKRKNLVWITGNWTRNNLGWTWRPGHWKRIKH
ncbi:MAG: hypothetical protein AAGI38_23835 [Bacteroidota bacterium]